MVAVPFEGQPVPPLIALGSGAPRHLLDCAHGLT